MKSKFLKTVALATCLTVAVPANIYFANATTVKAETQQDATFTANGTITCVDGSTMNYTFAKGVLTISGKGDEIKDSIFSGNENITKVVFDDSCTLTSLDFLFADCSNLTTVENIPDTVTSINHAFSNTAISKLPTLPSQLKSMQFAFSGCENLSKIDFSKIPSGVYDFFNAFSGTSVEDVKVTLPKNISDEDSMEINFAYTFANCSKLKTMVIDATNLQPEQQLWLQAFCCGCESLTSFELKNIPENHPEPGIYAASSMFQDCKNLVSVKNDGYFIFSIDSAFENCTSLKTIKTKGFKDIYGTENICNVFKNCTALAGNYYIEISSNSQIYDNCYDNTKLAELLKDGFEEAFYNCSDKLTLHINCKPVVEGLCNAKEKGTILTDANIVYWEEGDKHTENETPDVTEAPVVSNEPTVTSTPTVSNKPTVTPTKAPVATKKPATASKKINTLKLTKYKKGTKVVAGKTLAKASVSVKIGAKTYKTTASKSGAFTINLKSKLKKKDTIKVTVTKSGYAKKVMSFKVK